MCSNPPPDGPVEPRPGQQPTSVPQPPPAAATAPANSGRPAGLVSPYLMQLCTFSVLAGLVGGALTFWAFLVLPIAIIAGFGVAVAAWGFADKAMNGGHARE